MKSAILLGLVILFLSAMAWAQEKVEAPIWNVGDKWAYKRVDGVTWTVEVVDVKEDLYILRTHGVQDLSGYDKKSMNVKYSIEQSGRRLKATGYMNKLFDFPIFVGKKWTDTTTAMSSSRRVEETYINDFKVEGAEEVITRAGTFKTLKIHYKQTNMFGRNGWVVFWYSPEAKTWVKREVEKTDYWTTIKWIKDAELTSFSLK
jgi:hypothetical protein